MRRILVKVLVLLFITTSSNPSAAGQEAGHSHGYSHGTPMANCRNQSCGSFSDIPYPFTLTKNNQTCPPFDNNPFFNLYCNESTSQLFLLPSVLGLFYDNRTLTTLQVVQISEGSIVVNVTDKASVMKESGSEEIECVAANTVIDLPALGRGPYVIDGVDNKLAAFGCTIGYVFTANAIVSNNNIETYNGHETLAGCSVNLIEDVNNPACANQTCCIVPNILTDSRSMANSSDTPPLLPNSIRYANYYVNHAVYIVQDSPLCGLCSHNYVTLFFPNASDLLSRSFAIKLNWALPTPILYNFTDDEELPPNYACSSFSSPVPVPEIQGYRCSCLPGFFGDGYANGTGCSDIDECRDPMLNACVKDSKCGNTNGNYVCSCNSRFHVGDGRSDGSGCKFSSTIRNTIIIASGIFTFLLLLIIGMRIISFWTKHMRQRYFIANGGSQLQEIMKAKGHETFKIFSASELKVATNNYATDMKIGFGGFGTVYKGVLDNGKLVAIKKGINPGNVNNEQILNEIVILGQINHRHIVKLLGCCLETRTPHLVYEYVSNGTLAENLERNDSHVMGWEERLKVALQTSNALAYLHRAASPPILHRDVKSTNVLLDVNWDAKVGDFGISRLVLDGRDHVSTDVQGTLGYLDPEYFQTLQLTDKSDVYSLGVVLVELITNLKPVDSINRLPEFSNLALLFIHHIKEDRLDKIIDPRLEEIASYNDFQHDWARKTRHSILSVAWLAYRCLAIFGHDRPSMTEVEHELRSNYQTLLGKSFIINEY